MKMLKFVRSLVYLAAMVSAAQAQPLVAQGQDDALRGPIEPHPAADEAIARLKSPYCPGQMLEVCTSYTGALLRDSMQALAREGMTTDELVEWMLARHGEEYLAYPRASGAGLVAWLVPPAAILLGILVVVTTLRYMRRSAPPEEVVPLELSAEEEDRLREALKEMDSAEEPVF
ncbi:MAG: cytochrome c-type biogenesis protein CcmH [Longimicrobiales bacterium]